MDGLAMQDGDAAQASIYARLAENPGLFLEMPTTALYDLDPARLAELQLTLLQRQFDALRPKVKVLDRLAQEVGIDSIRALEDLSPLGLPHTFYKSYRLSDLEKGRYDRLTNWLQTLTSVDLSGVDVAGCDGLENWLLAIEAATTLRPVSSSGTSGKISILPHGIVEESHRAQMLPRFLDAYPGEKGVDIRDGDVPLICPWPSDGGRQVFINIVDKARALYYRGHEDIVITLAKGRITADELQLASAMRKAEIEGVDFLPSEREARVLDAVAQRNRDVPDRLAHFVDNVIGRLAGRKVVVYTFWTQLYQIAALCKEKGVTVDWSPDSIILGGGGTKGFVFPDGWRDLVEEVFPFTVREMYGMSETSGASVKCSQNHLHPLPWGIYLALDPKTSEALPRKGRQTGRLLVHDLLSESLWPTTLSGDKVTIDYDGGCACGRKGIYLLNDVNRLSEAEGGDDKITCAKTPQAYERLEQFAVSI